MVLNVHRNQAVPVGEGIYYTVKERCPHQGHIVPSSPPLCFHKPGEGWGVVVVVV